VDRGDRSSADLAQDLVQEAQDLIRLEIQLAKQEVRELVLRNGIAAGLLAFGALLMVLALLVALPVFLVVLWDDHVLGAAIWLGVYVVLGASLLLAGRLALRLEAPQRTLTSIQETKRWALRQIRSNSR
jgi:uncharacterized membrane protein